MGYLSAGEARSRLHIYEGYVEILKNELQKNFNDMDFENANRRDDVEEIVEMMKTACDNLIPSLMALSFEE